MKNPYEILRTPHLTEKATNQKAENNQITFKVAINATKKDIKKAVETIFDNVKVEKIQIIRMRGKEKRLGRNIGKRPDWKKAIVRLRPGDKIEYFEGV